MNSTVFGPKIKRRTLFDPVSFRLGSGLYQILLTVGEGVRFSTRGHDFARHDCSRVEQITIGTRIVCTIDRRK